MMQGVSKFVYLAQNGGKHTKCVHSLYHKKGKMLTLFKASFRIVADEILKYNTRFPGKNKLYFRRKQYYSMSSATIATGTSGE